MIGGSHPQCNIMAMGEVLKTGIVNEHDSEKWAELVKSMTRLNSREAMTVFREIDEHLIAINF